MKYTLYELLKTHHIRVPQIQRDYVQGRGDKKELRTGFISNIKKSLRAEGSLNLDFVYGYTQNIDKEDRAFVPMDGQQRLTTLWLLHWYLAPREIIKRGQHNGEKVDVEQLSVEDKAWLSKFTYETRNSSKRFCEELIKNGLPHSKGGLVNLIYDSSWFMSSWKNDPTVTAMLNMIDTIENSGFDREEDWKNLVSNNKITFDYIDIYSDNFKLTDELYIKMNSRGKPLTVFENFKASFSEILSSPDTDYKKETIAYKRSDISYQQYFSFKIDGVWMDLFWAFSKQNDGISVDDCFMNYFIYIAQMCYFKDNLDKKVEDFASDKFSVFKKKDNILFLFNTLDWFYNISFKNNQVDTMLIDDFFSKAFLTNPIDETYDNEVRLFNENHNLFKECLVHSDGLDSRFRIILYSLLSYAIKYKLVEVNQDLKSYIRVVRNLLQAQRQRKETVYNPDIRINDFGSYWKLFLQLMDKKNVYECLSGDIDNTRTEISGASFLNEKTKTAIILEDSVYAKPLFKLEEFDSFRGMINLLSPQENRDKLEQYSQAVREIWSNDNEQSLIIGAMIACGFRGFHTKNCKLGEMWYFGSHDNWNTILTSESGERENISKSIILLLDTYIANVELSPKEKLQSIIDSYLNSNIDRRWEYYFLTYPKMLSRMNYFAWGNNFEVRLLSTLGLNPLVAYHINPYVLVVSNLLDKSICEEGACYSLYSNVSGLWLNNGIELLCKLDGWYIQLPEGYKLDEGVKDRFNIGDDLVLHDTAKKDRVQIAVDFSKALFNINDTIPISV